MHAAAVEVKSSTPQQDEEAMAMGMWTCGHGMVWDGGGWDGMGWYGTCGHGMVWDGRQTAANSIQQEVMGWLGDATREVSQKLMKDLGAMCPSYHRTPKHAKFWM